jgi:acrylyl-CoA reductase (NADPH)
MTTDFQALIVEQQEGQTTASLQRLTQDQLPAGDVLVQVDYSSLNYKDAMAVTGTGKILRQFPMVPGVDLAGTVLESQSAAYQAGDRVVLTGWGVGERYWGGYSQLQRVNAQWLTPLPPSMDSLTAMTLGTAGLTAMLCVMALQEAGVTSGDVLVTGASGGVGSVAIQLLADAGYRVSALTQRPEELGDYLRQLGAADVIGGPEWNEAPTAPLAKQRWSGAVDVRGGHALARVLSETHYGGAVAACGLACDMALNTTVMPFILRGVRLLGVDSVMCPADRRSQAWSRLAQHTQRVSQAQMQRVIGLDDVATLAAQMMAGKAFGRVVIDVNR